MEKAIPAEAYAKSNEIWEASSYFSALEYPDEPPGEDSIEENYYTSLISSQQMVSNDYTSLFVNRIQFSILQYSCFQIRQNNSEHC